MKYFFCSLVVLSGIFALWSSGVCGEDIENCETLRWCVDSVSQNKDIREKALEKLIALENKEREMLMQNFKKLLTEKSFNNKESCPLHVTIVALQHLRTLEIVPDLTGIVDYELDKSTFRSGEKRHWSAYFPAANALAEIKSPDIWHLILNQLHKKNEDKTLKLYAWVLVKTYGKDVSMLLLNNQLPNKTDVTLDEKVKKLKEYTARGEMITPFE
ncbi:MAG: hypothetical protein HZA48_09710 [Planctomycetes bacterium]|nr:hypothetical protein [Planctomycetota bacterium]